MDGWSTYRFRALSEIAANEDPERALSEATSLLGEWGIEVSQVPSGTGHHSMVGEGSLVLSFNDDVSDDVRSYVQSTVLSIERRRVDRETSERASERFSMLSQASFEGLLIHENGVVIEVNERLCAISGWTEEELLGSGAIAKCVAVHDQPVVYEKMAIGFEGSYVITGLRKDGSTFKAELQSKQGRLGERRPVRVVAIRDVTERERMLELLRQSERQLRDLAQSVFELTVLSRDGVILAAQGPLLAEMGFDEQRLVGRPILEFVAPAAVPHTRQHIEGLSIGSYESLFVDSTGAQVPVEIVAATTSLDGMTTRIAGIRNLRRAKQLEADRHRLQQRVEQSTRLDSLGALAGGIAHDFGNLLMNIIGNAELLESEVTEAGHPMLKSLVAASEQAAALTRRLLNYARKGELHRDEAIALDELLSEITSGLFEHGHDKIRFKLDLDRNLTVLGDRTALSQVVMNLMMNARDASSPGGQVILKTSRVTHPDPRWEAAVGALVKPGNWALVEVEDLGVGMDEATRHRVFEPFFTTKSTGHGLGLAACVGIIEAHGGAIHIHSVLGEGTRFSVLLPLASPGEGRQSSLDRAQLSDASRVLIADADVVYRRQLERSLHLRGFDVGFADSGQACLREAGTRSFDVVVLDLALPDMNTDNVIRQLRANAAIMPIVLTAGAFDTASGDPWGIESFQAFLRKPFSVDELISTIEQVSESSSP